MKNIVLGGRKIVSGCGSVNFLKSVKANKAFVVTGGRSMIANGTIEKIQKIFNENQCLTKVYPGIPKNPDTGIILDGIAAMHEFQPDLLLAVGGGSSLDAAKVMGLFYEYPQLNFDNVLGTTLPERRKKLTFIAIPSTSGTASEVTRAAVVTFKNRELKIGLKTTAFIPDIAILDGDITLSMPDHVVAETGMDAVTHAVECYINHDLDDFTECFAKGAVEGLFRYLPISYNEKTIESREKVHHYQCLAGIAFDNVGLGMAHGISHAIGGKFNLGHGLINAIALPYVLEYNRRDTKVKEKLTVLAKTVEKPDFIVAVKELNTMMRIPKSLRSVGINQQDFDQSLPLLVSNSLKGSTMRNPVPVTAAKMQDILYRLYEGALE